MGGLPFPAEKGGREEWIGVGDRGKKEEGTGRQGGKENSSQDIKRINQSLKKYRFHPIKTLAVC